MDARQIAKNAYHAYAGVTDNKNFRGEEMPAFDDLPPKIQEAWTAAVLGAFDSVPYSFPVFYPVEAKLPEPGKLVLVKMLDGKTEIIRTGYHLPRFHRLEEAFAQYNSDLNPVDGKHYWPEDWYEYFWGEDCDSPFPAVVVGWMEIPGLPTEMATTGVQALVAELLRMIQEHGNPPIECLKARGGTTWTDEVESVEFTNGTIQIR